MQHTLIIDTSLGGVALATAQLTADSYTMTDKFICTQRRAAERELATATQAMLAHAPPLHKTIVAIGPGSFTGIRIGIAFACGLAVSPQQLLGISSLSAIAARLAAQRNTDVHLYHAITADSGVVAYTEGGAVKLANVNLSTPLAVTDEVQVLIAGNWPHLAAQLGTQAEHLAADELLNQALQALAWQGQCMVSTNGTSKACGVASGVLVQAQGWPQPLYLKEPYVGEKT